VPTSRCRAGAVADARLRLASERGPWRW
jgi:hypothetical protein